MDIRREVSTLRKHTPKPLRTVAWRTLNLFQRGRPALLMRHVTIVPAAVVPPSGYEIRTWQPGDNEQWVALLEATGTFGKWSSERLAAETVGLIRDAQFFAVHGATIVAATGLVSRLLAGRPALEVAWVARHPAHRGHELGRSLLVRALRAAEEMPGSRPIYLYTDDHRLTAIDLYLDVGFVPDLTRHRSYPARWEEVFRGLACRRRRAASSAEDRPGSGENRPAAAADQRTA